MLLVDSNIFIYARGEHPNSEPCRALLASAESHREWMVPGLVLLELTHYYGDGGEYARAILNALPPVETLIDDFAWAFENYEEHRDLNDLILLANAHRLGARGVITYDGFFSRQTHFPGVSAVSPADLT